MGNFIEDIIEKDINENGLKQVITRFPPEPNGYLHIGHAKSINLNYGIAKKYGGKFYLRFDDTNPVKEDDEFVNSIIADVKWLGANEDELFFASDYFQMMYECAVKLINKGLAYIDDTTAEDMRNLRGTLTSGGGVESKNRNRDIKENLALFEDMKNGKIENGGLVLRAKIDMKSPNMNMRDPIIYRVLKAAHHRQGDKWCIYPMYDFAHPLEDLAEGITHSICTLEFEDHRPLYDWVLDSLEFSPRPHQYEFARLNIERTIMSKRYLKKLVDEGFVEGWDDPRMPTIAGLRRRGYTPSSIREFCERIGVAKANSEVETGQLESCIREELNLTATRAMTVLEPLELEIINMPSDKTEELDFDYMLKEEQFSRKVTFSNKLYIEKSDFSLSPPPKYKRMVLGGLVRLKSAYIVKCVDVVKNEMGEPIKVLAEIIEGTKSGSDNSGVKASGVIHWVDASNNAKLKVRMYDYLLIADKSEEDFAKRLNKESIVVYDAVGEKFLDNLKVAKSFQFIRQGYFCKDSKESGNVFNQIVSLKDSFTKVKK